jgi:ferredoxin
MPKIKFVRQDLQIDISSGSELTEIFNRHPHLPLKFGCRRGDCGVCVIKVVKGSEHLSKISAQEKLTLQKKRLNDNHHRLACQCAVNGDIELCNISQNPSNEGV